MGEFKNWSGERLETGVFTETSIEHLHRYALALEFVQNKKVLDIAAGEGYGANLLAQKASHVIGVDINSNVINQAKNKYQRPNLEFLCGSVENIPVPDKNVDVVASFETLEHVADHEKMLAEIKRVLATGGLLIISTPDKKNYTDKTGYKNPFHTKELYEEEFAALLNKYFKNVQFLDQQIALSSVITTENTQGLKRYTGNFREIKNDTADNRLYCIALASDELLPPLNNSVFNGQSVFAEALSANEKMITNTITYKVGHIILYPAKLLKKLFKKKV